MYVSLTLEFLNTVSLFQEHINFPDTKEADLSSEERRAVDRYFYFSNLEYVLIKHGTVDPSMVAQWLRGIKSSARKRCLVERWQSTASKFTLDEGFREFFEQAIREVQPKQEAA